MTPGADARAAATRAVETALAETGLPVERTDEHTFVVTLEGEHKLRTTVSLAVGDHALSINAFVARRPDENAEAVYRWLLERNRRMYAVAFCIDHLGDVYLSGRTSLEAVTRDEVDRILGCVAEYSDGSFNTILELGFATAIRREWKWRVDRGEPTGNLEAFRHLAEQSDAG
jgi:hypothetical protein